MSIDKRDRLKEEPFDYKITKQGKMFITYEGRQIMILSEKETAKIKRKMDGQDSFGVQMVLAKVTGNFKHGNER
jgi:hypothetical protein